MQNAAMAIPEKLFFKIGEVCELTGVQAHVLRYWESEFSMLSPQKNRAGQRTYRRRDVEIALRIRGLLYDEMYTIAGARKRLGTELRGASKLKVVTPDMTPDRDHSPEAAPIAHVSAPPPGSGVGPETRATAEKSGLSAEQRAALRNLVNDLRSVLDLLDDGNGKA